MTETVDATKVRYDGEDALKLLDGIDTLIAAKGKKLEVFDLKSERLPGSVERGSTRPANDELLARMMGPTGNLRAPTARVGRTLVVGFSEEAYRRVLGVG